jgi:urea transporter
MRFGAVRPFRAIVAAIDDVLAPNDVGPKACKEGDAVPREMLSPTIEPIPRPHRGPAGWVAIGALVLLGIGATAGGIALVVKPDGSVMQMPLSYLDGSPFTDYLVPGLILGGMFGFGSLLVAAMGMLRLRAAPFLAFIIGCGQMIWIAVQLTIIEEFSFLHPTMFGVGLVIAAASVLWARPMLRAIVNDWRFATAMAS